MKMIKVRINNNPQYKIDTRYIKGYNHVIIHISDVELTVGHPIVPMLNKGLQWWQKSRLWHILCYYRANKKQVQLDILHREISNDLNDLYPNDFYEDAARKEWSLQCTINESEKYVPNWLKNWFDHKLELYYEKCLLQNEKQEQDEN